MVKSFTEADEVFWLRRRSSYRFSDYLGQEAPHQTVKRTAQKEKEDGLARRRVAEEIVKRLGVREVAEMPEFKEFLHTFIHWRVEILKYFDYWITNGFVEGKNTRIKTIKRRGYGYRNLGNFRLRILATNSKGARSEFHTY